MAVIGLTSTLTLLIDFTKHKLVRVFKPASPTVAVATLTNEKPEQIWLDNEHHDGKYDIEAPTSIPPELMRYLISTSN